MIHLVVSIINFNSNDQTLDCLNSIEKSSLKDINLQVIVIDNNSVIPFSFSQNFIKNINCRIIRNSDNKGFSGGHNIGIKFALEQNADYILILNNDTIVDRNLFKKLLDTAEQNDKIGLLSPKIYFSPGSEFHKDRYQKRELGKIIWYAGGDMDWKNLIGIHRGVDEVDTGQFDKKGATDFTTGACMLIKRKVMEEIGFFDERYFLYYEDADINERVRRKGYLIYYMPDAVLWHNNAGSAGGSGSKLQDYYITRNRLLFGLTYAPLKTKIALIKESVRLGIYGREWQKRGVRDFYLRRYGKGSFEV